MNRPHNLCRGCGNPCDRRSPWHPECLKAYRKSDDYRAKTLERDGYNCTKCWDWHNRAANAAYAWRWKHTPYWLRHRVGQHRPVIADHVDAIGGPTGTHAPTNLHILCKRHNKKKTRRDLARLAHRHVPAKFPPWVIPLTLAVVFATYLFAPGTWQHSAPGLAGAAVATTVFGIRYRFRSKFKAGLRTGLAGITGDVPTKRRTLFARRWRFRKVAPYRLPRLRPTWVKIRYPHTFRDDDRDQLAKIEAKIEAKCGQESWYFQWFTGANQVLGISPDPLERVGGILWPYANAERMSLWDDIPIGLGEDGRVITVNVIERNVLIGGEPGGGKSNTQHLFTAAAALDPDVVLYGIDGKRGIELRDWAPSMHTLVGKSQDTVKDAIDLLEHIRKTMENRYDELDDLRDEIGLPVRKVTRHLGLPLHVLVVDELASFTSSATKAQSEKFSATLRNIIERGRAAGVIVIAATQRPSAEVVPTAVRDLIGIRLAHRSTTPQSSDMILGQGWASRGFNAAHIPVKHRGVGFLLKENGEPERLRTFHVPDGTLAAVAARAAVLRSGLAGSGEGTDARVPRPSVEVAAPTLPASV